MPFKTSADGISSASKVSREIKKLSDKYGNFNKISLRSCYGAKGGCFSQGQVIADKTQTSVAAYKGIYTQQGGAPHLGSGGKLKIFEPSSSHIKRKINNFGNRMLGSPMAIVQNLISRFN